MNDDTRRKELIEEAALEADLLVPNAVMAPPTPTIALPSAALVPPKILLPLVVASALFVENLDQSVLSIALPDVAASFNESPIHMKLALTAYLLTVAVCLPASGWLADRFGARNIFRLAIVLFLAGSVGCGFSSSIEQLVLARVLQGVGGAMLQPVGRLIVLRSVPRNEFIAAMSWVFTPTLIAPVIGPLIGGFVSTYFEWRWIFWINVPIAAIGLVLAHLYIPDIRAEGRTSFDGLGFVMIGTGIAACLLGAQGLGLKALPVPLVSAVIAGGLCLVLLYWFHSRRRADPILDLSLFANRNFWASMGGGVFMRIGVGGMPFLLPVMLQTGFGLTAFQAGAITFTIALSAIFMKPLTTFFLRRFGFRIVLTVNSVFFALAAGLPGLFPFLPALAFYPILAFAGLTRSLQMSTVTILAISDLPAARMSQATTMTGVVQTLTQSAGISVAALLLQWQVGSSGVIEAMDFVTPFMILGALSFISTPFFYHIAKDAGAEVSGHKS